MFVKRERSTSSDVGEALGIGDETFLDRLKALYAQRICASKRPEDAAFRRVGVYLGEKEVLGTVAEVLGCDVEDFRVRRKSSALRPFAARFLTRFAGLDQRATARVLGLGTGAAVGAQLKRYAGMTARSRSLRRLAGECQRRLESASAGQTKTAWP